MVTLQEENPISLRTAMVVEQKDQHFFFLSPPNMTRTGDQNWQKTDETWLFRRKRSVWGEIKGRISGDHFFRDLKPNPFTLPLDLSLLWSETGNSVALLIQSIPWAFICEESNHGYSKGIRRPTLGNPWNQALFEKTFGV